MLCWSRCSCGFSLFRWRAGRAATPSCREYLSHPPLFATNRTKKNGFAAKGSFIQIGRRACRRALPSSDSARRVDSYAAFATRFVFLSKRLRSLISLYVCNPQFQRCHSANFFKVRAHRIRNRRRNLIIPRHRLNEPCSGLMLTKHSPT